MHANEQTILNENCRPPVKNRAAIIFSVFPVWFISLFAMGQFTGLPAFKQQVFNSSNGLCNNNIRVIAKDKTGFLWIGTANGLSRFDGHFFTNFFHTPGDSNTLGHNFIQGIICDKSGNIWVLHVLGLSVFDPKTQYFSNYHIRHTYPHFSGTFTAFAEDHNGNLWIGNQNGLGIFNTRQKQYLSPERLNQFIFRAEKGINGNSINGIIKGDKGSIWLNTHSNLFLWDPLRQKTVDYGQPPIQGLNYSFALNDADTTNHILYVSSFTRGLLVFDYQNKAWKQYRSGPEALSTANYDPVRSLQPYHSGIRAYISELGIGFFDPSAGKLSPLLPVPFSHERNMTCLFADSGHLWAGTDNGLFLLTPEKIKLQQISPPNRGQGAFNTVQAHPREPFVYSGNYGNPAVYRLPDSGGLKANLAGITGYLRYFFTDRKGNEWISTEESVFKKAAGAKAWKKIPIGYAESRLREPLPRNFAEDEAGRIWLRIRNAGICRFEEEKQAFIPFEKPGLPQQGIFSGLLYMPATKTLWLSEENTGLYALTGGASKWVNHPLQLAQTPLTPARIVAGVKGEIAFPDPFNGIGIYDPATKTIRLISQKNGLLSNNVSSIEADSEGNFWTFSTEGISKVMAGDFSVVNYRESALAKIQEIACGNDGMVYIAAAEGLYCLNGNLLKAGKTNGRLLINKVEVMGKPYPFVSGFKLPPGNSDIQIFFSYIDLYPARKPAFEYRFETEKDWKSLDERNSISFSRLSPGDYVLTIREKQENNAANWQKLTWSIAKPYWQTSWFLAAVVLVAGALTYYFTQQRISAIREKAALQQKMAETEMAALQAQMNPHFIFNSINCIDAMVQEGDKYNATTYLNKFAKLLRNVLEGSRNATVSLTSDLETLRLYMELECMRMDENFTWEINLPEKVAAADIRVPSLIIQPYVENAILHGIRHLTDKKGRLTVTLDMTEDQLMYTITDNGVGRAFSRSVQHRPHKSFGLDITRERIEHFNNNKGGKVTINDLVNEKSEALGTEVKVWLPLN